MKLWSRQTGFSLIEAMVALLVIAVGLLGIAGLQALSVNNTSTARTRALAAIEASNMASYMGANSSYWAAQIGGVKNLTVDPSKAVVHNLISDPVLNALTANCESGTCASQDLAAYDLRQWGGSDQLGLLPGGIGVINCNSLGVCQVAVGWRQQTAGINGVQSLASAITYYRMVVQP